MTRRTHFFTALIAVSALLFVVPARAELQRTEIETIVKDYLAAHPEELERVVKDYLIKNPDVLREALAEMIKRRVPTAAKSASAPRPAQTAAIQSNAKLLFDSDHQLVLGNPHGNVTMVEFFDYNCGFCRRALGDTLTLLKDDPDLRVVLKDFPILGPGSLDAARVSIAVRMQDSSGVKYLEFHRRLLAGAGPADKTSALAIARDIGLDMAQIERDLASDEVRASLEESMTLGRTIGISGTPGYVIGNMIVPGAVGAARLKENIALARKTAHQ